MVVCYAPHACARTAADRSFRADELNIVRDVLDGIRYRRVDSAWMLSAFFNSLERWLTAHSKVSELPSIGGRHTARQRWRSPMRIREEPTH